MDKGPGEKNRWVSNLLCPQGGLREAPPWETLGEEGRAKRGTWDDRNGCDNCNMSLWLAAAETVK